MIRPVAPTDSNALIALTAGTGFFKPLELETLREVLDDYHEYNQDLGHRAFIWEENSHILGYVYHAPAAMTDRTWYLYWIAVAQDAQGRGIGRKLLQCVEEDIRELDGRLLLIETATTPHYEPTRQFYLKCGYELVATIPDYYADEDGMAIFSRRIPSK
jgi:ribosomal protein S18 acetylase RimI-like enzyme